MAEERFTSTTNAPKSPPWVSAQLEDLRTIVSVKQQAVEVASHFTEKIAQDLPGEGEDGEFSAMAGKEITELLDEAKSLRKTSRDFKIFVGVRGVTGAGKTSLFNSLLGMPILPVSSTEASTATVCHISWNYDDDPRKACKAEVSFCSTAEVTQELDTLLKTVMKRSKLKALVDGRRLTDDEEAMKYQFDELITELLEKWRKVWDLDESKIATPGQTAEAIIKSNPDVSKLLDTKKNIEGKSPTKFARMIKPYVDTSRTTDRTIVWPLVREVKVYVKSEILRGNIDLVDLPGCSDGVSSRSKIAEKYSKQLEFSIIVLPASRAVDENTGVNLMTEHQRLEMRLAGNSHSHNNTFCVAVSKIDDVGDDFLRSAPAVEDDKLREYQRSLVELKSQLKEIKRRIKAEEKVRNTLDEKLSGEREIKDRLKQEQNKPTKKNADKKPPKALARQEELTEFRRRHRATFKKRDQTVVIINSLNEEKAKLEEKQQVVARDVRRRLVWIRGNYIKERIQEDFKYRQKQLTQNSNEASFYYGEVDVFPICSREYQNRLEGKEISDQAFPSRRHTGIPRLQQWIEESAYEARQKHLDTLLASFQRILQDINRWCGDRASGRVEFARRQVLEILTACTSEYGGQAWEHFKYLINHIRGLLPVADRKRGVKLCGVVGAKEAANWVKKYPDNPMREENMSWLTYQAIITRDGGPYTSTASGVVYDWPQTLSIAFLNMIINQWTDVFDSKIPVLAKDYCSLVITTWNKFVEELKEHIITTAPNLKAHVTNLDEELVGISKELCTEAKLAVEAMCKSARRTYGICDNSIREDLIEIFELALEEKGQSSMLNILLEAMGFNILLGAGSFSARQDVIIQGVREKCTDMFEGAYDKMEAARQTDTDSLRSALRNITHSKFKAAMNKVTILMTKLEAIPRSNDQEALDKRTSLQTKVAGSTLLWETRWRSLSRITKPEVVESSDIPEEYMEDPAKDDQDMSDADSSDDDSD